MSGYKLKKTAQESMQPYSIDLRKKIIEVYKQEKISIRNLAKLFYVAKSFVQKLLKQEQQTGDISPKRQGGNSRAISF
ncbi:Transposase [Gloeocapsa sp. PCC 73106]|nr:Transposase [Gloeocapsa sp. PCC 73106]